MYMYMYVFVANSNHIILYCTIPPNNEYIVNLVGVNQIHPIRAHQNSLAVLLTLASSIICMIYLKVTIICRYIFLRFWLILRGLNFAICM
jgi:hypothetical protein